MKTDEMESALRRWSRQQQVLRRYLAKDEEYPKAIRVFLSQHALVHTARPGREAQWSFQDHILGELTYEQMRLIPKGCTHSIAWMIWHIARIEDVTTNLLLAGRPQVFKSGNWQDKMGVAYVEVGNDMPAGDIARLSQAVAMNALLDYRLAVGKRTRQLVCRVKLEDLRRPPASERLKRVLDEQAVGEKSSWLLKYWGGHTSANLLLMPATRHCFVHLNEARRMLPRLKRLPLN